MKKAPHALPDQWPATTPKLENASGGAPCSQPTPPIILSKIWKYEEKADDNKGTKVYSWSAASADATRNVGIPVAEPEKIDAQVHFIFPVYGIVTSIILCSRCPMLFYRFYSFFFYNYWGRKRVHKLFFK